MAIDPTEHARLIATPALMGQHLGARLLGRPYHIYPWIAFLERRVLSLLLAPGRRIIIVSVPPQNGKTTYFGLLLPFWYLGMNPYNQLIFISYNIDQASKWGLKTRDAVKRFGRELFGIKIHPDSDSASDWKLDNGFGGMMSAGILSGITGNPGHLIIPDDLIKNAEEAGSTTHKEKVIGEVQDSVLTRFQNDTKMLMIATRWAEDDPSGYFIALSEAADYAGIPIEVINLKAIAEPSFEEKRTMTDEEREQWRDVLGRREGEHLVGQFDLDYYRERKATVDSYGWNSLYQGEPAVREGGMFPIQHWRYWTPDTLPEMVRRVRVWDLASSEGRGDWTVGTLMGRSAASGFYILDRIRVRKGPAGVEGEVIAAAKRDGHEVAIRIEEERSGAGKTVIDAYKRKLIGYDVGRCKAETSKVQRATAYANEQNKGNVYLPEHASWLDEWRDEHAQMIDEKRMPRHDDQIDTGAYAFRELTEGGVSELWTPEMLGLAGALGGEPDMDFLAVQRIFR